MADGETARLRAECEHLRKEMLSGAEREEVLENEIAHRDEDLQVAKERHAEACLATEQWRLEAKAWEEKAAVAMARLKAEGILPVTPSNPWRLSPAAIHRQPPASAAGLAPSSPAPPLR